MCCTNVKKIAHAFILNYKHKKNVFCFYELEYETMFIRLY